MASATGPYYGYSRFSRSEPLLFIQVGPQLSLPGCLDAVPDTLFVRKPDSAGNPIQGLWVCSQEP
jgi:hypothetical protein